MVDKKIIFLCLVLILVQSSVISVQTTSNQQFSDPLCAIFDQKTGKCKSCICRAYFDKNHRCQAVSDLCQTWNINSGDCTSCYKGYQLINGTCCTTIQNYDPKNEDQIINVNPNCETDDGNGTCLGCRLYYTLRCGDCQTTGENPFCSQFNAQDTCVKCAAGFSLDVNNVCQQNGSGENTTCEIYQNCVECNAEECTSCIEGYRQEYVSRKCVLPTENCTDGCALCSPNQCFACSEGYSAQSWPICIYCSYMNSKNSKGKCVPILKDCSAFPNCNFCVEGQCSGCNEGYKLNEKLQCMQE